MDVSAPTLLVLKMVRSEELASYPELLARVRAASPGHRVVWATTAQGAALLGDAGVDVPVLKIAEGGFSPSSLRGAVARVRASAPAACLIAYENPRRSGNLALEVLALASGSRRILDLADGRAFTALSRGILALRVLRGMVTGVAVISAALVAGCAIALVLPLAAYTCRLTARGRLRGRRRP